MGAELPYWLKNKYLWLFCSHTALQGSPGLLGRAGKGTEKGKTKWEKGSGATPHQAKNGGYFLIFLKKATKEGYDKRLYNYTQHGRRGKY